MIGARNSNGARSVCSRSGPPVATGAVDSKPRPSPPVVGNKRKKEGHASGKWRSGFVF